MKQEEIARDDSSDEEKETEDNATDNEYAVKDFIKEQVEKVSKVFFNKDIKIVSIGDSLTQGVGDEAENGGYVGILESTINQEKDLIEIQNFGKRGNRTDQLLERMKEPEIKQSLEEADIILITIGANDLMQVFKENFTNLELKQFDTEKIQYQKRLREILSIMEGNGSNADIYLIGFYNPFEQYFSNIKEIEWIVEDWNSTGRQTAESFDSVSYIPIDDLFMDANIQYFSEDNFHPNHLGYELIAERVLEYITNEGETNLE